MQIEMLYSKLHRATVTDACLGYEGSIGIDKTLMEKANLVANQRVHIYNVTNGERFETYVIEAEADSGTITIHGAAAHKAKMGDIVIIVAYASFHKDEMKDWKPTLVFLGDDNKVKEKK